MLLGGRRLEKWGQCQSRNRMLVRVLWVGVLDWLTGFRDICVYEIYVTLIIMEKDR